MTDYADSHHLRVAVLSLASAEQAIDSLSDRDQASFAREPMKQLLNMLANYPKRVKRGEAGR